MLPQTTSWSVCWSGFVGPGRGLPPTSGSASVIRRWMDCNATFAVLGSCRRNSKALREEKSKPTPVIDRHRQRRFNNYIAQLGTPIILGTGFRATQPYHVHVMQPKLPVIYPAKFIEGGVIRYDGVAACIIGILPEQWINIERAVGIKGCASGKRDWRRIRQKYHACKSGYRQLRHPNYGWFSAK